MLDDGATQAHCRRKNGEDEDGSEHVVLDLLAASRTVATPVDMR